MYCLLRIYEVESEEEDEDISDDSGPSTSRKTRGKTGKGASSLKFHLCGRPYRTMDGYKKHLNMHIMADLLKNTPRHFAVREECRRVYPEVLQELQGLKPKCGYTESVGNIAEKLQAFPIERTAIFVDPVAEELYSCLPDLSVTDIHKFHLTEKTLVVLTDKRPVLMDFLKADLVTSEFCESALEWFLTDFIRRLSAKVEAFFLRCLREPYNTLLYSSEENRDDTDDINFQQTLYYIGGSTVKSVMRKAWNYCTSESWKLIYECMLSKFVIGEDLIGPGEEIESWTNSLDRGGLQKINLKVWSFVVALSGVLKKEEGEDGSILHERVFKVISSDDVLMFLWNDITENSLKEEIDILLLHNFCEFFTNTWLQGVILRRKNAISRLSRDKQPLRARLSTT